MKIELWQLILGTLSTIVGSGYVSNRLTARNEREKLKNERAQIEANKNEAVQSRLSVEMQSALEMLRDHIKSLEKRIEALEKENKELREREDKKDHEISLLQATILSLNTTFDDFPLPVWFKDYEGRMRYFNKAYELTFIIPNNKKPSDYIGKTDAEYWGEPGDAFRFNDQRPLKLGNGRTYWRGKEKVPIAGELEDWFILKYVERKAGVIVGFRGLALGRVGEDF